MKCAHCGHPLPGDRVKPNTPTCKHCYGLLCQWCATGTGRTPCVADSKDPNQTSFDVTKPMVEP